MRTLPPKTINEYQILGEIGHGGVGTVYLGKDLNLDRFAAIKVLSSEYVDADQHDRFLKEAKDACKLSHANIVTVYGFGHFEKDGSPRPYIAFEYVQGRSLADLIRDRETFQRNITLDDKLRMLEELCDGISHAHRANLVHRDIKPANVMVQDSGSIKILDFGIARSLDPDATRTVSVAGTARYMSPEQAQLALAAPGSEGKTTIDTRSDVFAVGAVFYELLTYHPAFDGESQLAVLNRVINYDPEPLDALCPGIDPELKRIVTKAMQKDARKRYQVLEEMRADIERVRARLRRVDVTVVSPKPSIPRRPAARRGLASFAFRRKTTVQSNNRSAPRLSGVGVSTLDEAASLGIATGRARSKQFWVRAVLAVFIVVGSGAIVVWMMRAPIPPPPPQPALLASANLPWFDVGIVSTSEPSRDVAGSVEKERVAELEQQFARQYQRAITLASQGSLLEAVDAGKAAEALLPGDGRMNRFWESLLIDARKAADVAKAKALSEHAEEFASEDYRDANARLDDGLRESSARRFPAAIQSVLAAKDLYSRAAQNPARPRVDTVTNGNEPVNLPPAPIDGRLQNERNEIASTLKNLQMAFGQRNLDVLRMLWPTNDFQKKLSVSGYKSGTLTITPLDGATVDLDKLTATLQCDIKTEIDYGRDLQRLRFKGGKSIDRTKQVLSLRKDAGVWTVVSQADTKP